MTASQDSLVTAPEPESPPSAYADQMPKLREFAALPDADPRRDAVREELILAFLPVVHHLARRHATVPASVEELTQAGTVALITAIDRWDPKLARGEFLATSFRVCAERCCAGSATAPGRHGYRDG